MQSRLVAMIAVAVVLSLSAQTQTKPVRQATPKQAASPGDDSQLYRNTAFGFRFQIPYGWVDRSQQMQEGSESGKSELLLAVFERPPGAIGDTVNSAAVFAVESAAAYPGLKKAEDYLGPLTELATGKGFKPDGEPYLLDVESRQLLRADFVKTLEGKATEAKDNGEKLTMRQCTLVLLTKGQIVSFTFIAGSEDELDDLMDGLHFSETKLPAHKNLP